VPLEPLDTQPPDDSFSKTIEGLNEMEEHDMPPSPPKPPNLTCHLMAKPPNFPNARYELTRNDSVSKCFPHLFYVHDMFNYVCYPLKHICIPRNDVFSLALLFKFGEVGTPRMKFAKMPKVLVGCTISLLCLSKVASLLNENRLLSFETLTDYYAKRKNKHTITLAPHAPIDDSIKGVALILFPTYFKP